MTEVISLHPGERIVWTGRPDPMGYFVWNGRTPLVLGLLCLAVWSLLIMGLIPRRMISEQRHFGALLLFFGCTGLGTAIYHLIKARSLRYVITDRRAVVAWNLFSDEYAELPLDQIAGLDIRVSSGNYGHVMFLNPSLRAIVSFWKRLPEGFIAIADPGDVSRTLKAEIERATGRAVEDGS